MKTVKVTYNRFLYLGFFVSVYRHQEDNRVWFETYVEAVSLNDDGNYVIQPVTPEPVNVTATVSRRDSKAQCDLSMCSLATGITWIDMNLK